MTSLHPNKLKYLQNYKVKKRPQILETYRQSLKQIALFGNKTTQDEKAKEFLLKETRKGFKNLKRNIAPRKVHKFVLKQSKFVEILKQANRHDYAKVIKVLTDAY
jgi:hypothetical protein